MHELVNHVGPNGVEKQFLSPAIAVGNGAGSRPARRGLLPCAVRTRFIGRGQHYRFSHRFARRIPRPNAKERDMMRQFAKTVTSGKMLKVKGFQAFRRAQNLAC